MSPKTTKSQHATAADTTAAVDALVCALAHPAEAHIQALRAMLLAADPAVREGVKWNAPSFRTTEYFATTHLRAKAGLGVVLHFGAKARAGTPSRSAIADPEGLLRWLADDRAIVHFATLPEMRQREQAFLAIVRQWIQHV